MQQLNNESYLQQIASVGDREKIIAANDIYSVAGIKLLGQGSQVNTRIYQKILSHKLAKPIDESLTIENCITTEAIIERIIHLGEYNILAIPILEKSSNKQFILRILRSTKIPKPLLFRLSILNLSMESTVDHCLLVALTSIYLAYRLNLDTKKIIKLAYAAIFLDIGLLHLDYEIFSKKTPLSIDERKQIYSHPIIAALIMKSYVNDREICTSIIDHHERADGSGYPKGKVLEDISENGQILGIAELAVTLSQSRGKYSYKSHIQAILKFNSEQYEKEVLLVLLELISVIDTPDEAYNVDSNNISASRVDFVDIMLKLWSALNNYTDENDAPNVISEYIKNQITSLKYNLNMSGLSMDIFVMSNSDIDEIIHESEEVHALVDEAFYKLKNLIQEVKRRWSDTITSNSSYSNIDNWLKQADNILN